MLINFLLIVQQIFVIVSFYGSGMDQLQKLQLIKCQVFHRHLNKLQSSLVVFLPGGYAAGQIMVYDGNVIFGEMNIKFHIGSTMFGSTFE